VTLIGFLGVLLAFAFVPFATRQMTLGRLNLIAVLLIVHLTSALIYYRYTQSNFVDAYGYYFAPRNFAGKSWAYLGSVLVGHVVQAMKFHLKASYLDCFIVFQTIGFWGIMVLMRSFSEIHEKACAKPTTLPTYILFLPSMQFWTSAIGKDAPMFFAISLCTWSALNFSKRKIVLVISVVIMLLLRPHIALATVIAFALASLSHSQVNAGRKILVLLVTLMAIGFLLSAVRSSFDVNLIDSDSLSRFMDTRSVNEATDTANSSIAGYGFFLRAIGLLFRPIFFDAANAFGFIASIENVGSILLFLYLAMHMREIVYMSGRVLFIRFALVLSMIFIAVLSLMNYNIGLGLRERVMVMPPLFSLFVARYAFGRGRVLLRQQQLPYSPGVPAKQESNGVVTT